MGILSLNIKDWIFFVSLLALALVAAQEPSTELILSSQSLPAPQIESNALTLK